MKITKKVAFIAKDESIEELKALLVMMVEPSRAEKGCLQYDIFQMASEPKKFIVIESWADEASLEGHKVSEHYKHYKTHFEPFAADKYSDELIIL